MNKRNQLYWVDKKVIKRVKEIKRKYEKKR